MATWEFAKSIGSGGGDKTVTVTLGTGGCVNGDPLVVSGTTGTYIVAAATTAKPEYVATGTAVSGGTIAAIPCLPENVFIATSTGNPVAGVAYDLTTANVVNGAGTTTGGAKVIGRTAGFATDTKVYVIGRGW